MDDRLEAKRMQIVDQMKELGSHIEEGNDIELLVWIIPRKLACAHRPLRHHPWYGGSGITLPASAKTLLMDWIIQMREEGIKSIISFMHDGDLGCYSEMELGGLDLLGFLEQQGFIVERLPWEDPAHKHTIQHLKRAKEAYMQRAALEAYDRLPKPVLLQCSAGRDRSAPVAVYIWQHRSE